MGCCCTANWARAVGMNWIANIGLNCQRAAWPREAAWIVLNCKTRTTLYKGEGAAAYIA